MSDPQGQNKEAALRLLRAQLLQRRLAEQAMEQNALRGEGERCAVGQSNSIVCCTSV